MNLSTSENKNTNAGQILHRVASKAFDAKHKTNLSGKKVPDTFYEAVRVQGVTLESLEAMKVPICIYRTQITLHGKHDITAERAGKYKNLILNQNNSLGVKYSAIDYAKKQHISKLFRLANAPIVTSEDSTGTYFWVRETKALVPYESVDTSLYIGEKMRVLWRTLFESFYIHLYKVEAIKESMIPAFFENVTSMKYSDVLVLLEAEEAKEALEEEAREARYQARKAKEDADKARIATNVAKRKAANFAGAKPVLASQVIKLIEQGKPVKFAIMREHYIGHFEIEKKPFGRKLMQMYKISGEPYTCINDDKNLKQINSYLLKHEIFTMPTSWK